MLAAERETGPKVLFERPTGDLEAFRVDVAVYAANAPIVLTDLDLSAVGGTRTVLALLAFVHGGGANRNLTTRRNGSIELASPNGIEGGVASHNEVTHLLTPTDANGIIEWRMNVADFTTVTIHGYIVQS